MEKKSLNVFDPSTGEIMEGLPVMYLGKKTGFNRLYGAGGWFVMASNAATMIARDKTLRGESKNVLWYLMGRLDFENFIQVPQVEIAEDLDMHKPHVSRAIKQLIERKILIEGPKVGRSFSWRLNPNFGYMGNPKNVKRDMRKGYLYLVKNHQKESEPEK